MWGYSHMFQGAFNVSEQKRVCSVLYSLHYKHKPIIQRQSLQTDCHCLEDILLYLHDSVSDDFEWPSDYCTDYCTVFFFSFFLFCLVFNALHHWEHLTPFPCSLVYLPGNPVQTKQAPHSQILLWAPMNLD